MRPVIDLSVLNQHLIVTHFKMETNRSIRGSIHLGMWTTSLDLTRRLLPYSYFPQVPQVPEICLGRQGIRFQDDAFLLRDHTHFVIGLLLKLGFLISWKKSELVPSQDFIFLGEHYRTDLGLVFPPEEKIVTLQFLVNKFFQISSVPARQFLQLIGFLISLMDVIPLGRLHI
jgi:hypothetical protein